LSTSSRSWAEDKSSKLSEGLTKSLNLNHSRWRKQKSGLAHGFAGITNNSRKSLK